MTPAEIGRIFEPFSQGDHGSDGGTHRFGGLGLGLAISRMLVEQHSGSIRATSWRNLGTTFAIELPLLEDGERLEEPADPRRPALAAAPAETEPPGRRLRILLVEDHHIRLAPP